nr:hypothetical protein HK105_002018 [Polyrhizophydium stewartii]
MLKSWQLVGPCVLDDADPGRGLVYVLSDDLAELSRYRCPSNLCDTGTCTVNGTLQNIAKVPSPKCGEFFKVLAQSNSTIPSPTPDDLTPMLARSVRGGATLASALYIQTTIPKPQQPARLCSTSPIQARALYLYENCTQANSTHWIQSLFSDIGGGSVSTVVCTSSDCTTSCTEVASYLKPKPAATSRPLCAEIYSRQISIGPAIALKASSQFNTGSPRGTLGFTPPQPSPSPNAPGTMIPDMTQSRSVLVGIVFAAVVGTSLLLGAVVANIMGRRAAAAQRRQEMQAAPNNGGGRHSRQVSDALSDVSEVAVPVVPSPVPAQTAVLDETTLPRTSVADGSHVSQQTTLNPGSNVASSAATAWQHGRSSRTALPASIKLAETARVASQHWSSLGVPAGFHPESEPLTPLAPPQRESQDLVSSPSLTIVTVPSPSPPPDQPCER